MFAFQMSDEVAAILVFGNSKFVFAKVTSDTFPAFEFQLVHSDKLLAESTHGGEEHTCEVNWYFEC